MLTVVSARTNAIPFPGAALALGVSCGLSGPEMTVFRECELVEDGSQNRKASIDDPQSRFEDIEESIFESSVGHIQVVELEHSMYPITNNHHNAIKVNNTFNTQ